MEVNNDDIIYTTRMSEEKKPDRLGDLLNVDTESDENVKNLVSELTTSKNIETKTDINQNQISVYGRGIWYARRYGIDTLDSYIREELLPLAVSKGRGGRKDIVEALSAVFRFALEKQQNQNVKV